MFNPGNVVKLALRSGLVRNSGIYTIASFANAAIPFLLLPLLTTRLSTTDYGIITMFSTVQAFLYPVVSFNLEGAVARKYYSGNTVFNEYIGNSLIIFIFTTLLSFCLVLGIRGLISDYTEIPEEWVIIIPVVCAAQFLCTLALTLWQVREQPRKYAGFQISQSTVNALLTVIFVVGLSFDWTGRILAICASTGFFALIAIGIFISHHDIKFVYNPEYIKHALKFGGGLVPHALGGTLILLTNRIFLTRMVSIEESGLYGVANQICSVMTFLTFSFNNAYVPWLFRKLTENKEGEKARIVRFTYIYFFGIIIIGLAYFLVQPLIFKYFIGKEFLPALRYCFLITMAFAFQGMYFMVTNYINYAEKTYLQALVTICVGLLNIPLNYLFIKHFGSTGAALSFTVIFFLLFITTWLLSARVYKMPWLKMSGS